MHTTHFELASLAVQVAHWRGKKDPQFVEAMEILGSAREHLANPWKARTGEDYERILQIATPKSYGEPGDAVPAEPLKKFEEIINAINEALATHDRPAHPDLREPQEFPAKRVSCIRLITKIATDEDRLSLKFIENSAKPEGVSKIDSEVQSRTLLIEIQKLEQEIKSGISSKANVRGSDSFGKDFKGTLRPG